MSPVALELRDAIIEIAGAPVGFENRKGWLDRAARLADVPYRTAKAIIYRECRDPRASVVEKIRARRDAARAARNAARETVEARARVEFQSLSERIARIEARLASLDQDKDRARADVRREVGRIRRDVDRAMDS